MPNFEVQRHFGVVFAKPTRSLRYRLCQVGRSEVLPNGNIAIYSNPFYTDGEFHRKASNLVKVDRMLEGDYL
jgi:hypothetical protein|nr:MAG TPA: hypothetical protein [Caudoviricetes sp.]